MLFWALCWTPGDPRAIGSHVSLCAPHSERRSQDPILTLTSPWPRMLQSLRRSAPERGSANANKAGLDHRSAQILGWAQWFNSFFLEDVFYFWSSIPEIWFSWKRKYKCGWAYSCPTLSPHPLVSHSPFFSSKHLLLFGGLSVPSRPFSLSFYSHRWFPLSETQQLMPQLGNSNSGTKITKISKQQNRLLHFLNILRIKGGQLWHNLLFLNDCFSNILRQGHVHSISDK